MAEAAPVSKHSESKNDIDSYLSSLVASTEPLDLRRELVDNLLPLLMSMIDGSAKVEALEEMGEAVADLEDAVDQLIDGSEEILHPESAIKIAGMIEIGKILANELEGMLKRVKVSDQNHLRRMRDAIAAFRQGSEVVEDLLEEITIEPTEEPEAAAQAPGPHLASVPDPDADDDAGDDLSDVGEVE